MNEDVIEAIKTALDGVLIGGDQAASIEIGYIAEEGVAEATLYILSPPIAKLIHEFLDEQMGDSEKVDWENEDGEP